jgi:hypothetical protein
MLRAASDARDGQPPPQTELSVFVLISVIAPISRAGASPHNPTMPRSARTPIMREPLPAVSLLALAQSRQPGAAAAHRSSYRRAMGACRQGRGYTVN